jgi:uncharacterized repeat protein (TIGR01451 family)
LDGDGDEAPDCDIGAVEFNPEVSLTILKQGEGAGTIRSTLPGIDCGEMCTIEYESGTSIELEGLADGASVLGQWLGCDSVAEGICSLDLNSDRTVIATFDVASTDLKIVKTASTVAIEAGSSFSYEIVVVNNGPNLASDVLVTDVLPRAVDFSAASAGCLYDDRIVQCAVGTLAVGESRTFEVFVSVPGVLTNVVHVSSTTPDINPGDNRADAKIGLLPIRVVPAIGTWSLLILGLAVGVLMAIYLRRRPTEATSK